MNWDKVAEALRANAEASYDNAQEWKKMRCEDRAHAYLMQSDLLNALATALNLGVKHSTEQESGK